MLPIMLFSLAYLLGIIGGLYKICIIPFCLIICFYTYKRKKLLLLCFVIFAVGFFYSIYKANSFDYKYQDNNIFVVNAKIVSDPIIKDKSISYIARSKGGDKFIIYTNNNNLKFGMKINISGKLEIPPLNKNRRRI